MSFHDDETSVSGSRPREGFEFILPSVTYRLATGSKAVVINGQTYQPTTMERGSVSPSVADGAPGELEVKIVTTHPFVQRYLRGVPPQRIDVNVWRKQLNSGEVEMVWQGRVTGCSVEGVIASFLVTQTISDVLARRIPTITIGRECPHVLYDGGCRVPRASFRVDTTIAMMNGRIVSVASMGGQPDGWAKYGEILHVATGERMTIHSQSGNEIQMQLPIADMQVGDAVQVFAGCDRTIGTCHQKFANQVNYGGMPQLPQNNPFISNGYGIYESK